MDAMSEIQIALFTPTESSVNEKQDLTPYF